MTEADKFRKSLEELKLSPADFAYLVDRSARCIGYYCEGKRRIPTYIYVKLSEFQELDPVDLWKKLPEKWRKK